MNQLNWGEFEEKLGLWSNYFKPFFTSRRAFDMYQEIKKEAKDFTIYPKSIDTFRAFKETNPKNLKTVLIFQDPYAGEIGLGKPQANGVAIDCRDKPLTPTLSAFYDGMEDDLGEEVLRSNSLEYLSEQGVLLLNTALTVRKGEFGSHLNIWEPFTEYFFKEVSPYFTGITYGFFGKKSQSFKKFINEKANYIFEAPHPVSSKYSGVKWNHGNIFTKINESLGDDPVFWNRKDWASIIEDLPF